MRKTKTYIIDLFDDLHPSAKVINKVQDAEFWSSDTNAWLSFGVTSQSFTIDSAEINLYNKNDKTLLVRPMSVVNNEAQFEMVPNIISHFGEWSAQVIFKSGGKSHTSPTVRFTVSRRLGADLPERLGLIREWEDLNDEVKEFVAEIEGFTLDQFVKTKMGEELANLEVNYATRLTGLESNDVSHTAQLAQKAGKDALEATGKRIDELIIGSGDANAEVTDAHVSVPKNKTFSTISARIKENEEDFISHQSIQFPATNKVSNGDFSNGAEKWASVTSSFSVLDGKAKFTASAKNGRIQTAINFVKGHKYYMKSEITSTSPLVYMTIAGVGNTYHPGNGRGKVSNVFEWNLNSADWYLSVRDERTSGWDEVTVENVIALDLTEIFGGGNEPNVSDMDIILSEFPNGWFNGTVAPLINNKKIHFKQKSILEDLSILKNQISGSTSSVKTIPNKSISVAAAGSSITWGDGLLDSGYVGVLDDYLRNELSDSLLSSEVESTGEKSIINNPKMYKGQGIRVTGVGGSFKFKLSGNELSVVHAMERSNVGASLIDLYVDGELYDTFSNFNESPSGTAQQSFTGDGTTIRFDLGRAFTYAHVVKKNGVTLTGSMNTTTTGATVTSDYLIVRKISADRKEVRHFLWLKHAPSPSDTIVVDFKYGENIVYAKTTVGETRESIDSPLETAYGDGTTAYDLSQPTAVSSGLDYRKTDKRAVKTWKFAENKTREFEIRIKSTDPRATGAPYFILNFVTNRMHFIKNAGIGGYTSSKFRTDSNTLGVESVMEDAPDVVFFESGTNDDWYTSKFVATRAVTMTEEELRNTTTIWLKSAQYISDDRYSVETSVLEITGATSRSVTMDNAGAVFDGVKAGDILLVGNYSGDNREVQTRIITTWDNTTKTASFSKPLITDGTFNALTPLDLVGKEVRIKRADEFIEDYQRAIDKMIAFNPHVEIGLIDTGLANFYSRLLIGLPDKIAEVAKSKQQCSYTPVYDYLTEWQYSQPQNETAYINTPDHKTATGANEYSLVNLSGENVMKNSYGVRNFSVKVNGVEVYGRDCYISGGMGYFLKSSTSPEDLSINDWNGRSVSDWRLNDIKLVFYKNIPVSGAVIDVKYSKEKWSGDDTHLANDSAGAYLYGHRVFDSLKKLIF